MLLHWLNENLVAWNFCLPHPHRQRRALLRRDSSGAPITDFSRRIQRAKISPRCHIARPHFKSDSRRLERPTANQIFDRVISEQPQMSRAAPRRDSWTDGNARPLHAELRQQIQIRLFCRFQFCFASRRHRQATQAVGHQHDDLGIALNVQFTSEGMRVHRGKESGVRNQEPEDRIPSRRRVRQQPTVLAEQRYFGDNKS